MHTHVVAMNRLPVGKRVVRRNGYRPGIARVRIVVVIGGAAVEPVRVVDIRVVYVDAVPIAITAAIPRPVGLSPT